MRDTVVEINHSKHLDILGHFNRNAFGIEPFIYNRQAYLIFVGIRKVDTTDYEENLAGKGDLTMCYIHL